MIMKAKDYLEDRDIIPNIRIEEYPEKCFEVILDYGRTEYTLCETGCWEYADAICSAMKECGAAI